MKYLVKISKKARIMELKRRHLKITVLTSYTPYPSRKIRRICACTSLKTMKEQDQYAFILVYVLLYATYHSTGSSDTDQIVSLVGQAGDPWDQQVCSQLIGKDLISRLTNYDDEDYTVIFDKNSFSYKIISVNDLKTDSENDNEKVNMPSFPSPEPMISYFDDLDFLKDFKNEFPAIVYNDSLTSKSDSSTEPVEIHIIIDEFDSNEEHIVPKYDEEE
ncbi:hypothetical protein Tco_0451819 [Tanacetum coccineum]